LTLWVALGLAVGFFAQYTFDMNAWSHLASVSLTITTVGLFAFALVGARSRSDAPKACALGGGGFFLSMLVCILGILIIYPETLPLVLAIVASIALWKLCFFAERHLVLRQIAIFGAAAARAAILCHPV